MTNSPVIEFLRTVGGRPDILDSLKVRGKDDVIAAAAGLGYPFSSEEFNTIVWQLEEQLAAERGEQFDGQFPLWQLMWGKYYLEYLVIDLIPSFQETQLVP